MIAIRWKIFEGFIKLQLMESTYRVLEITLKNLNYTLEILLSDFRFVSELWKYAKWTEEKNKKIFHFFFKNLEKVRRKIWEKNKMMMTISRMCCDAIYFSTYFHSTRSSHSSQIINNFMIVNFLCSYTLSIYDRQRGMIMITMMEALLWKFNLFTSTWLDAHFHKICL